MDKGGGTVTSSGNTGPWAPQQPYLTDIFSQAQNLYQNNTPQFFPGSTVQGLNDLQTSALNTQAAAGQNGQPVVQPAMGFLSSLLGGASPLSAMAQPGSSSTEGQNFLNALENGNWSPAMSGLQSLGGTNVGLNNPGSAALQGFQGTNVAAGSPGYGVLNNIAGTNQSTVNPFNAPLSMFASGAQAGTDSPYTQALTDSVTSHVLPGIQAQFINGGMLSSPEAARSSSEGVTNALGPLLFQRQQQEEQNQLGAANTLAGQFMQGAGLQANAANMGMQGLLSGRGQQIGAAGALNSGALQGAGIQQSALSSLGGLQNQAAIALAQNEMQGRALEQGAASSLGDQMLGGLRLAPQTQQLPYNDLTQLYNAGSTYQQQGQQQLNDQIARFNFGQQLPYQQLAQYIGEVTGNYGGVSNLTQPNQQSPFASILGGAQGVNSLLGSNGMFGSSGMFGSGGSLGGLFGGGAGAGAAAGGLDFGGGGAAMGIADSVPNILPAAAMAWIICTELVRQGRLPRKWWASGARVFANYPEIAKRGYYVWAIPSVRHLRRKPNSLYSRVLAKVFNWRAEDIAARKGVKGARKLWRGRAVTAALAVPCLVLGACAKKQDWQSVYAAEIG